MDGIYYNIVSLNDLTCEVTYNPDNRKYETLYFNAGLMSESHSYSYPSYNGDVTIPQTVNYKGRELTVTGIGRYAFLNCRDLTSLFLPSTISNIETLKLQTSSTTTYYAGAFDYCNIKTLTVGNAYTLRMFNHSTAKNNAKTYNNLTTLVLADSFEGIIEVDFSSYNNLTSIRSNANNIPAFSADTHFSEQQILNLEVLVPEDALAAYQSADVWKEFWELKPMKSVRTITFNQTSLTLEPNQTFQLSATVLPVDAYDASVVWSSSDPNVATVDTNGFVTAITKGDAIITAQAADGSGVMAQCEVHVDLLVKSIQLSETEIGLEPGNSKQLQVSIEPTDAFNKGVIWSSGNENVATVDLYGKITAKNTGVTNITVTTTDGSNLTASCKVTVAILVKSITVTHGVTTIKEGETLQLSYSVAPENATYKDVIWTSDDNDVATVNATGLVTAISSGIVKIRANASDGSNVFGECEVTVTAETFEDAGICYQRNSPSTLKIVANSQHPYSGDFVIPSVAIVNGEEMQVTEIDENAFANCHELTRLVIPNTIRKVKETAFRGCSQLVYAKICDGSSIEANLDTLFPDSPIDELYIGSDGITYDSDSRILGIVKGITLGKSVSTFPPSKAFNTLQRFVVEDGDTPIIEPEDYCSSSMSLINTQNIRDTYTYIYYRFFYTITYTHLSPILNALENSVLNYLHIGRDVQGVSVDTSVTTETKPTTQGDRYAEMGWKDEYNYSYIELIAKKEYNKNPVESIILENSIIELNMGESIKLSAICTPQNASYTTLEWSSSNENVATVDIWGNVTKRADGEAVITASTTDGSNLSATCRIVDFGTGLSNITIDKSTNFNVYNLQGVLIYKNCTYTKFNRLNPGIYIIRQGDRAEKVFIR